MSSSQVQPQGKKTGFAGFFGFVLELCIVFGGVLWVAYAYLPHQYYLPISLAAVCVVGFLAYFVLNRKLNL